MRLIYWSLRSTAIFAFIGPCCWPFLSIFLHPLPFSDLSSHSPPISAVVFLVFWSLLASLSRLFSVVYHLSFIRTTCPAHFILLLTILPFYTHFSSNFFSQLSLSVSPFSLHWLFSLSCCSHILVDYVDEVRIELTIEPLSKCRNICHLGQSAP